MTAQQFDQKLKADSTENRYKVEGAYIVFDKTSNLAYKITPNFSLGEFLTKNKVNSATRINKAVILKLQRIREALGEPITVNSSFRDFYYNKMVGGATNSEHTKGNALDITSKDVQRLHAVCLNEWENTGGGVGLYDTFCHIDTGEKRLWDEQGKKYSAEDGLLILTDERKNWAVLGCLAVLLFFLIKR